MKYTCCQVVAKNPSCPSTFHMSGNTWSSSMARYVWPLKLSPLWRKYGPKMLPLPCMTVKTMIFLSPYTMFLPTEFLKHNYQKLKLFYCYIQKFALIYALLKEGCVKDTFKLFLEFIFLMKKWSRI